LCSAPRRAGGHSRCWGYWPSGALGAILLIIVIFALLGYL
jgi:hypothetical protein